MPRIGVVTCRVLPEPDPDQAPLLAALAGAGLEAGLVPWDDPEADPGAFGLCVLRSCWNFYEAPEAFLAWIEAAAARTRLVNSAALVRWNLHKGYLREVAAAGAPVVPTLWVARGERLDLAAAAGRRAWREIVIKPAISASSFRTGRFAADRGEATAAQDFLDRLAEERDVMVQPYFRRAGEGGETSAVWIDGAWTHAVRKRPRFAGEDESVSAARPLRDDELGAARRALAAAPEEPLYARVDLFEDDAGRPHVSELEVMEPSLFFVQSPPALERFVAAIRRLGA